MSWSQRLMVQSFKSWDAGFEFGLGHVLDVIFPIAPLQIERHQLNVTTSIENLQP